MATTIQTQEVDPKWERVYEALSDPKWDFRTVEGIARSAGLSEDEVAEILDRHKDEIRRSLVPDRHGRVLYTLIRFSGELFTAEALVSVAGVAGGG